jgi:hypothetical protein
MLDTFYRCHSESRTFILLDAFTSKLTTDFINQFQNNKEKEMLALLQREAESSYPINEQTISPIQEQHYVQQVPAQQIAPIAAPAFDSKLQVIFEKINSNLERIANRLDEVDVQVKSKRVSRIK